MNPLERLLRLIRPGQSKTAYSQSRNAVSALGQSESFATYVGTWLAGITIGVVLILSIAGIAIFGTEQMQTAAASTSDRNGTALIGNRPISERETVAQEGYAVFKNVGCQTCHLAGGYGVAGTGPRLVYSGNARDSTYIHSIVRWGYAPMPYYPERASQQEQDNGIRALSATDLYKIVAYLQYTHDNRKSKPAWVDN